MLLSKIVGRFGVVAGIGCTLHCVFEYVCDFVVCSGDSMRPTLSSNNILITNKVAHRFSNFKRNDIVISIHPNQPKNLICKRLVAVGGDIILMNSPSNGDTKNEENSESQTIYIKPGSCWLEGDNRTNSTDSRHYGQIPMGLIKSKVFARIWPPSEFRLF